MESGKVSLITTKLGLTGLDGTGRKDVVQVEPESEAARVINSVEVPGVVHPQQVIEQEANDLMVLYSKNLAGRVHDIRVPLSAIRSRVRTVQTLCAEFVNSQEFRNFEAVYQRFTVGSGRSVLSVLDEWSAKAGEPSVSAKQRLVNCHDYGKSVVAEETRQLLVCVQELAQRIKTIDGCLGHSESIVNNAQSVESLVNSFIEYGGDNYSGSPVVFKPSTLIRETIDSIQGTWPGLQLHFTVEDPRHKDSQISMDPVLFKTGVLSNLISNSAKACSKIDQEGYEPQCRIFVEQKGERVIIRLHDNGPGIPYGKEEEIFQEGVSSTHGEGKGEGGGKNLGLGLPNVRKYLEAAGGSIKVDMDVSGGACFVIDMPAVSSSTTKVQPAKNIDERKPLSTGPYRILVIDDHRDTASSMKILMDMILPKGQYLVTTATSVKEAVEQVRASGNPPHLILTDLNLNERDDKGGTVYGPHIKRRLKDELNCTGIKVIVISGEIDVKRNFPDIDGEIPKPVEPIKLCNTFIPGEREKFFASLGK